MHPLELAILETFRATRETALSTTKLVESVMGESYTKAIDLIKSPDKLHERRGKQQKARLHRKLLYHINKLVDDDILKISGVRGRGEKLFELAIEGNVEITSGRKKITIRKNEHIATPIDDSKTITPYGRENWLARANAILLEGEQHETLGELADYLRQIDELVNDACGILRFETLLNTTIAEYEDFLSSIARLEHKIVMIISLPKTSDDTRILRFFRVYCENKPNNAEVIFNITPKVLQERRELLEQIITLGMQHTIKLNLKNSATHKAPIIAGTAGTYTLHNWEEYTKNRTQKGVAISGASVAIDLSGKERAHDLARLAARTLFLVGRARHLTRLREAGILLNHLDDTIRFWNFNLEDETLTAEINAAREVIDSFCTMHERIYRACGIPIRCRVRLSSAFGKYPGLTPRAYQKITVRGLTTLQQEIFVEHLCRREELCKEFDVDRIRVFRSGDARASDILRELSFLLNTYALPYITYDFSKLRGDLKLTEFFGGRQ